MKPRICILKTDGINCDQETAYAFEKAGGNASIISVHTLKEEKNVLNNFQILALPGGFSYGDDVASGKILAVELLAHLKDQLHEFILQDKLILGICNGFQVLTQLGLLPFKTMGKKQATLAHNNSNKFECRWVTMRIEKSPCIFTQGLEGTEISLQVAHGEGKFFTSLELLNEIEQLGLVPLRYTHQSVATQEYPHNPNGSLHAIAGICDKTGKIFGLMPHPERYVEQHQHPNWRRTPHISPHGLLFFKRAIEYVQ